jgi:multiple sugar transport system permease protein
MAKVKRGSSSLLSLLADNQTVLGYLFILPSLIGFIVFYAYPAIRSIGISFTEWNMLSAPEFVGLANYQEIFTDDRFWRALRNTLLYVIYNIPLQTALALAMAVMLDRASDVLSTFLRGLIILPWIMPSVVVALLWLWILDPSLGIANVFLNAIGIPSQDFLGDPNQALPLIAGINIWRHAGYNAILIYAGLKTIPKGLFEAASIDGASRTRQFWSITLPLLRPVLAFVVITTVIGSFQIFDTIAVTTGGGPAGATSVIIGYIYEQVFERRIKMGVATAASTVLFAILVLITLIQNRFLRADQSDLADYQ